MAYKKVRLGDYLLGYDEINKDGEFSAIDDLQGINNEKYFQGCQSNKNDIDLSRYRICRHGMFAYNKATSRNGEKISIAYRTNGDCLISPSYVCFSVKDEDVLIPEYLMHWFKRPEFDRYARFNSWGSATEFFTWEDFQEIEFELPDIEIQKAAVNSLNVFNKRIEVLSSLCKMYENICELIFEDMFGEKYRSDVPDDGWQWVTIDDVCDVKGGKRIPKGEEFSDEPTKHPYIRISDMYSGKYVEINEDFKYITDDVHEIIKKYIANSGDVIIANVGMTAGTVAVVGDSLDGANLTENCVKLINLKDVSSDYLYYFWKYHVNSNGLDALLVGAAQPKLPMYNIQNTKLLKPPVDVLEVFNRRVNVFSSLMKQYQKEIIQLQLLKKKIIR